MMLIIDVLKFLLFFIFTYLIPGYVIIGRSNIEPRAVRVFLAITLGFSLSALCGYLGQRFYYALIIISSVLFVATRRYKDFIGRFNFRIDKDSAIVILLISLGILFQSTNTFRTGINYSYGVGYWGALAHDGVWHHALVNELIKNVPPQNPGFSGTRLINYHYFYDLLVAQNAKITGVAIPDLIYRYYPFIFSLLLGIGTYLLSNQLFNNKWVSIIAVYLAYFGSSFGWIVEWIKDRTLGGESAFWANQPVSFNINPPFAISLILLIAFCLGFKYFSDKKNLWLVVALTLIGGAMIEFKVYAGLILLSSLLIVALKKLVFDKKYWGFLIFLSVLIVSLFVFLPGSSGSVGFVAFTPFWIIHSMVDIVDRVGWPRLSLARTVGLATYNWPKFIAAEAVGLFLFVAGNLGTRIIAIGSMVIIPIKKWWQDNTYFLIFAMLFVSIITTLLFVQKGNPWNIIQFFYYSLYFFALFAAYALVVLLEKLPRFLARVVLFFFMVLTPVSSVWTFNSGLHGNVSYIDKGEIAALNFFKGEPDGVILTYPYNQYLRNIVKNQAPLPIWAYETSVYVSAYSNKETYLEDFMQQEILGNDSKSRLNLAEKYFSQQMTTKEENDFLHKAQISYIYVPKPLTPRVNTKPNGKIIFENDGAIIYSITKE